MKKIMLMFAAVSSLPAATFYVSQQGNDGNPGSAVEPWATLQHAVDRIGLGDTILVEA